MINKLNEIVRDAGQIARDYYGHITIEYKPDHSVITEADLAVEKYLHDSLLELIPSSNFLGEEGTASEEHFNSEYLWIVDPIDGTSSYSRGLPIWGVSVGLYRMGVPYLASVYFPLVDNHYWCDTDKHAFLNGRELKALEADVEIKSDTFICVPSNLFKDCGITVGLKMRAYGSSCYHILQVGRGTAYAAVLCNLGIWDIAGSAAIARLTGAMMFDMEGKEIELSDMVKSGNIPEPLIVTRADRVGQVLGRINLNR